MKLRLVALLLLAAAFPVRAATVLVPSDHDLVLASKAVVVATAGVSTSRFAPGGWIETVTTMELEESLRGPLEPGSSIEVVELGGEVGTTGLAIAGAPRYAPGERMLLFLEKTDRGEWAAKNMAVGRFTFTADARGRALLLRDGRGLCGWDYDGTAHQEPQRLAAPFLDYVRGVARGESPALDYVVHDPVKLTVESVASSATPTIGSYLLTDNGGNGLRWNSFPTASVFYSNGSQPGAVNGGLTAAQRGLAAWTGDANSNIVYQYGGTTTVTNGLTKSDFVNTFVFNDPAGEIPGSYTGKGGDTLAVGGAWYSTALTHSFGGETFDTIQEADLVVQDGLTGAGVAGNGFDHVLTHELGHTLGLRHSDSAPPGGTSSTTALMNSTVNFDNDPYGANLQAWDREAIAAVYGSGASACTPPQITVQPKSVSLTGPNVVVSVTATGSTPLQYQWYIGAKGSTAQAVSGGTTAQIVVSPATTTSYWVRVSNGCAPSVDSDAAIVTVNGCPAVLISSVSGAGTIIQGHSTTLGVSASGGTAALSWQWYTGAPGDTSSPIAGATASTVTVAPPVTTTYWVRVANSCGAFAVSDPIGVNVVRCDPAQIVVQPSGGQFVAGDRITLSATVIGTAPLQLQWSQNGVAIPNATTSTVTVGPLFVPASFALHAVNDCGDVTSSTVAYSAVASCVVPTLQAVQTNVQVPNGGSAILAISPAGTSLEIQWYEGQFPDFTRPVGASSARLYLATVTAAKQYWARVTNNCGSVDSSTFTVTPVAVRRRAAGR